MTDDLFISLPRLLEGIDDIAPANGGAMAVDEIASRLIRHGVFDERLSADARRAVIRRALEWGNAGKFGLTATVPIVIHVDLSTGDVLTDPPPGGKPVGSEVIFEPKT